MPPITVPLAIPATRHPGDLAAVSDYVALLKPRVMSLVVFTGFVGLYLAPGHLHPVLAVVAVLAIAVAAGAAGAINMWYDRDIDAVMKRTRGRPLPAGRMAPGEALGFGAVLAASSVLVMGIAINLTAAALLVLTIGFYIFIYTMWLKRRSPQNIVIGGAAGAFPPLIGWAAVTGEVGVPALALFALIFLWTPPHFWALALYRAGDYEAAGIPMMPVVAGARETKKQMIAYTIALWPVALMPTVLGVTGWIYGGAALGLSAAFTLCAFRVWFDRGQGAARQMFAFSILYLFLLFALMVVDRAGA
ncbi:MAG TPA: heme o synthase [Stellaceae bacterium]|nr:heme o synthase [Stellaceae bacterium]